MEHRVSLEADGAELREHVRQCLQHCEEKYREYSFESSWSGESDARIVAKSALGNVNGTLRVSDGAVDFDVKIPLLLRPFRKVIKDRIDDELRQV